MESPKCRQAIIATFRGRAAISTERETGRLLARNLISLLDTIRGFGYFESRCVRECPGDIILSSDILRSPCPYVQDKFWDSSKLNGFALMPCEMATCAMKSFCFFRPV